jgi:hypothetical protein
MDDTKILMPWALYEALQTIIVNLPGKGAGVTALDLHIEAGDNLPELRITAHVLGDDGKPVLETIAGTSEMRARTTTTKFKVVPEHTELDASYESVGWQYQHFSGFGGSSWSDQQYRNGQKCHDSREVFIRKELAR